jgi:hypothetical protein
MENVLKFSFIVSCYWYSYKVCHQQYLCEFDDLVLLTVTVLWCPVPPDG